MIGTIANVTTIVTGSLIGCILKKGLGEKYEKALMDALGLCATSLGINAVVKAMPDSHYPVLFIISLAIGAAIGTRLDLEESFKRAVGKISGGSELSRGLSTAILLYCIGTFSILGPIQSALWGDHTYLFTNAMLDFVTSIILSASFGFGIALAAVVLFCWQGSIYLLAHLIAPYLSDALMTEVGLVGGVLIISSGLAILKIKDFKTVNMIPALLVPAVAVPLLTMLGIGV